MGFVGFDNAGLAKLMLALSALLCWSYMLWFCYGFNNTGHLVVMMWRILVGDLVQFTCLTGIFLVGFSLAFFISETDPEERGLRLFGNQVFNCFHMATSGFDIEARRNSGSLITSLLVAYSILVSLLLLNVLIAMMSQRTPSRSGASSRPALSRPW